ncbi:cupin domain-containing protein [Kitasatospora putterlickiae]|uniref:Cupin domain-containing protein n=1 Tax=Kitasatospora putterlickiae TaxID=221725 RepID=A0ABN1Y5D8_9ACTN
MTSTPTVSFALHVPTAELLPDPLDPAQIVSGTPEVSALVLTGSATGETGVWQITPGTVTDVEADEVFTVLSGRATVVVDGGPTLELGPGVCGVLRAGERTTWTVHETLRKVYTITY